LRDTGPERERKSLNQLIQGANKAWHGVRLNQPDWSDNSHSLALWAEIRRENLLIYLILNFELPTVEGDSGELWRRWIDTSADTPRDIVEWEDSLPVPDQTYRAGPRSVVVLLARRGNDALLVPGKVR